MQISCFPLLCMTVWFTHAASMVCNIAGGCDGGDTQGLNLLTLKSRMNTSKGTKRLGWRKEWESRTFLKLSYSEGEYVHVQCSEYGMVAHHLVADQGQLVQKTRGKTLLECKRLCVDDQRCNSISYSDWFQECKLMDKVVTESSPAASKADIDFRTYFKVCVRKRCSEYSMAERSLVADEGQLTQRITDSTLQNCKQACIDDLLCPSFTYSETHKECRLMDKVGVSKDAAGTPKADFKTYFKKCGPETLPRSPEQPWQWAPGYCYSKTLSLCKDGREVDGWCPKPNQMTRNDCMRLCKAKGKSCCYWDDSVDYNCRAAKYSSRVCADTVQGSQNPNFVYVGACS